LELAPLAVPLATAPQVLELPIRWPPMTHQAIRIASFFTFESNMVLFDQFRWKTAGFSAAVWPQLKSSILSLLKLQLLRLRAWKWA
jgi:hypothetical protein